MITWGKCRAYTKVIQQQSGGGETDARENGGSLG